MYINLNQHELRQIRHVSWLHKTDEIYSFQLFSYRVRNIDSNGPQSAANHCWVMQQALRSSIVKMELHQHEFLENLLDTNQIKERIWTIKRSDLGGRGLFATKPITKGTLIFKNKPLVIGPRADHGSTPYCVVCYKISDASHKCDKCSMVLCFKECEASLDHTKLCDFVTKHWIPKPSSEQYSEALGGVLIYLHCMLLEDQNLLSVMLRSKINPQSHIEEINALSSKYNIPKEQTNFMSTINSILKINSFRIANSPQEKKIPLRGLYPLSSFLNHSCVPNTRSIFNNNYTMSVFATKDIENGEEILTCYTGLLWSTPARRCQLFKTKGFWCKCRRCEDRTEMGTKLSALKCLDKDCIGVLLPTLPTDPGTDWSCDNCETKVPANRICVVQSALGSLVRTLDLDDQFRLEALVLERLAKFIPYSSHIFVDLRLRLAIRVGSEGIKLNGNLFLYYNSVICRC